MLFTDAIALLKKHGHSYLATEAERVLKDLVRDEQCDQPNDNQGEIDPIEAVIQSRGFKMPQISRTIG